MWSCNLMCAIFYQHHLLCAGNAPFVIDSCSYPSPHLQVYVWEDRDDDDVITEYRSYEGHREDITHMTGRCRR